MNQIPQLIKVSKLCCLCPLTFFHTFGAPFRSTCTSSSSFDDHPWGYWSRVLRPTILGRFAHDPGSHYTSCNRCFLINSFNGVHNIRHICAVIIRGVECMMVLHTSNFIQICVEQFHDPEWLVLAWVLPTTIDMRYVPSQDALTGTDGSL